MIELYHYTNDERAEKIIRSGRIMASLKSSGDAAFGNGVYLTKLKPGTSTRVQVAQNNWLKTSHHILKKTKNVFILEIPDNEVENVSTENRDIFLFGGRKDLRLVKYKWYLQDFDTGKILASHMYHIGSAGPFASSRNKVIMENYVMTEETVNGRPVYQPSGHNHFLFMASNGRWVVGPNTDKDAGCLHQKDKYSLGPSAEGAWDYGVIGADGKGYWKGDDATLKAYPSYTCSQWKTDYHSDSSVDPGSTKPASTPSTATATRSNTPSTTTAPLTSSTAPPFFSFGQTSITTSATFVTSALVNYSGGSGPQQIAFASQSGLPASTITTTPSTKDPAPAFQFGQASTAPSYNLGAAVTTSVSASSFGATPVTKSAAGAATSAAASPPGVFQFGQTAPVTVSEPQQSPATIASSTASSPATAITTPTAVTAVRPKSTAASSNMPDSDDDKGLQTSGTTRSGRDYSGPPGKKTGLRRRLAAMIQCYPFKENSSSKQK